jgi:uncharacterized protein YjgD (DUF1641 family)
MMTAELASLEQKIDLLTTQVAFVNQQLEDQRRRYEALDAFKQEALPIANHFVRLSIDELADIGSDFAAEDLLYLFKRVLRNMDLLVDLLDRVERLTGLADETSVIGRQVFNNAIEKLDFLERQGYFAFMNASLSIVERIVTEFSEEDVHALGDNIVTILKTVRNMTQPEVLALANRAVETMQAEPEGPELSTLGLLRELGDPRVRKGMARMLNVVKVMAEQPLPGPKNGS